MAGRRYNDQEMTAIFRAAAERQEAPQGDVPGEEGLTLADLQAIGREVGIAPEAVAQAALALDVRAGTSSWTFLGLPLGVARTVNLNRRLTDEEWERLVVQLREVFNARGATQRDGSLRQWTNGNLQVLLEPTETGHRLRFRTVHGAARASIRMGILLWVVAGALSVGSAIDGSLGGAISSILPFLAGGAALIVSGALRLPRWARLRGKQMEALAAQIAAPTPPASPQTPPSALPPA
jgi:hypothetical protein